MARTTLTDAVFVTFAVVASGVGALEAARRDEAGLAVLFLMLLAAVVGRVLAARRPRRRAVLIRTDLHEWLEVTSTVTGESAGDLADRCISSHRARL